MSAYTTALHLPIPDCSAVKNNLQLMVFHGVFLGEYIMEILRLISTGSFTKSEALKLTSTCMYMIHEHYRNYGPDDEEIRRALFVQDHAEAFHFAIFETTFMLAMAYSMCQIPKSAAQAICVDECILIDDHIHFIYTSESIDLQHPPGSYVLEFLDDVRREALLDFPKVPIEV